MGSIQARTALTDADPARVPPTAVERERTPRPSFSLSTPQGRGNTTELVTTTGREWDPETGLYYYRARYYDPRLGRFISEDPIRFAGGNNFYAYVYGDPVNLVDPLGLWGDDGRNRAAAERAAGSMADCWVEMGGAAGVMYANYSRMVDVNIIGIDRYFHCMANCEGRQQGGPCAQFATQVISYAREVYGVFKWGLYEHWKKGTSWDDHASDTNADMTANA